MALYPRNVTDSLRRVVEYACYDKDVEMGVCGATQQLK